MHISTWVINILAPLLGAIISWAFLQLAGWLRSLAKTSWQRGVLDRLAYAVEMAVSATQQTTVQELRKAATDGTLTRAEAERVLEEAVQRILVYMGRHGVRDLKRIFATLDLQKLLETQIEALIHWRKAG